MILLLFGGGEEGGGGEVKRGYGKGFYVIILFFWRQGNKDSCRITLKQILKKNNNLSFVAADRNILFLLIGRSRGGEGEGVFFVCFVFLSPRQERVRTQSTESSLGRVENRKSSDSVTLDDRKRFYPFLFGMGGGEGSEVTMSVFVEECNYLLALRIVSTNKEQDFVLNECCNLFIN